MENDFEVMKKAFGGKQEIKETPKTIYRTKEVFKSPFDKQDLTDIEDLIYNKMSNYEINITRYKENHKIINDNDPRLKKQKNYREFERYKKILLKITNLKEDLEK